MINQLLAEVKKVYACKRIDVGVFDSVKIEGSNTHIEAYDAEGLGRIALVETNGFLKLWKMQSLIVNPIEKDAPIYYYHRHNRKGKDIYKVEVLNTLLDEREIHVFDSVIEKYTDIPELEDKENWYDEIKMSGTMLKSVKKAEGVKLDEVAVEHFAAYMKLLADAPECGKIRKKTEMQEFMDSLVDYAGIAVLQLFRAYYDKKVAEKLCLEILFGVK